MSEATMHRIVSVRDLDEKQCEGAESENDRSKVLTEGTA